jgi:DNA-binding winged helix-turn-helix (wHTH) protein/tetratricopeptide (TPR) repeat protein
MAESLCDSARVLAEELLEPRMDTPTGPRLTVRFGPFELDAAANELREEGRIRRLPAQPFRILMLLTGRPGQIVTRQEIRHCLWGDRKYVDVDGGINFCLNQIRAALRDPAESSRYIKTYPRNGYSFIAPVTIADSPEFRDRPAASGEPKAEFRRSPGTVMMCAVFLALIAGVAGDASVAPHHVLAAMKDTVVVAEFSNTTGDTVFDGTLDQALAVALRQSPFLQVLAETKVRQTLRLMGRSTDSRLTPDVAQELCIRSGSNALISGTISRIGSRYLVDMRAKACADGNVLASEQREVAYKEEVLHALSQAASNIRTGLGESLPLVQKFDAPAAATTASLEALQSYSQGIKILMRQGDAPSIPFFKRALELDPLFSMADATLAARYNNLDQPALALIYATKAYELRDHVSERERLVISTRYFRLKGELEKMTQGLEMWISEFPRDGNPHGSLGVNYMMLGQFSKALPELEESLRLSADDASTYENLATLRLVMNEPAKAKVILDAARARGLDSAGLRIEMYELAFIENDDAQMQRQIDWATSKPGTEDALYSLQSDTEAYYGRLAAARRFSLRAVDSAVRSDNSESAALWQANVSLREAEFGEQQQATQDAAQALRLASGRNVKVFSALAFARAGDVAKAEALVNELEAEYGGDTMLAVYRLPIIRAAIALSMGHPQRALDLLEPVRPYDLALPSPSGMAAMYPAFLRGQAYLEIGDLRAAATEFQKVVDQPGLTLNFVLPALARLELARTYSALGEVAKSKDAYQALAAIWRGADVNIPVLLSAKKELTGLLIDHPQ